MSAAALHRELLAWYGSEKRDLPWRRTRDPYRIWISEIMLQQTRVEAVLPYYERFLSHFPTVGDLASADQDKVLNLWAGLGYYSRARNLQAAARQVVESHGGRFPESLEELRALQGVGPYTAAAIASIAFGLPHAAIDGNLERVISRLLALRDDPKTSGKAAIAAFGEKLARLGSAGELNQAFMDLASRLCLPREPRCEECPIASHCRARAEGIQRELPVKKPKAAPVLLRAAAWAMIHREELLLARRPQGEWLAGMWDLPWQIVESGERPNARFGKPLGRALETRTITKHKIAFELEGLACDRRPTAREIRGLCAKAGDELRWVPLADLHGINLPRPSEKALEKILARL